eukprot:541697-Rhodomonas_salina.1
MGQVWMCLAKTRDSRLAVRILRTSAMDGCEITYGTTRRYVSHWSGFHPAHHMAKVTVSRDARSTERYCLMPPA